MTAPTSPEPRGSGDPGRAAGTSPHLSRTRSFSRRGGRMPQGHRTAYEHLAGRYVVDVPRGAGGVTTVDPDFRLDLPGTFGRQAPLVVEVGSGSGDALRAGAQARPDWDVLAVEVWRPGIAQTLARMGEHPLPNVRFVEADACLALSTMLEAGAAHEVWTFFPDPWPKARHHKRRLIQPAFVDTVHRLLEPGGLWRIATDWSDYAAHLREVMAADSRWTLASTGRAPLRPRTRFELKGLAAGREIVDLAYRA
ncbi:tRNA (guanosine(46)-N7)-methyltransferase TrmB [Ornithinimicrobium sediminis]|uniref:tRNA (guanosine(46)-N7)-methyltransferase TrmB n=1 Tax=Ornithinimicrobium sediminis TaxID=2904603 RepID=UPI001E4E7C59|nr:tRNA (guanosine(46)-N7)-methyltransferase TrmB [Ornithinimicrobium sediminis]